MIRILSAVAGYAWDFTNLSSSRVRWMSYLDRDSVAQIVMVCSLPILFYTTPRAAKVFLPLICLGLVVSIVQQKVREAEISEKIVKQNEELEEICKSFQAIAGGLEDAINGCLKVGQQKDALIQAVDQMDEGVDKRLERVKERIQTLSALCLKAQSSPSVLDLLATVKTSEARLQEVTQQTTRLNEQIDVIIRQLRDYVLQLGDHDAEVQKKKEILTGLIEEFDRRKNGY